MKKAQESPEAQEALRTLKTAERLNSAFIRNEAAGVRTLANELGTQQFPTKGFEDFYRDLSQSVGLEPQVSAIILGMAKAMKDRREYDLVTIENRRVRREIKDALIKLRPSRDEEFLAEGPHPGSDEFDQNQGHGGSRRLPVDTE